MLKHERTVATEEEYCLIIENYINFVCFSYSSLLMPNLPKSGLNCLRIRRSSLRKNTFLDVSDSVSCRCVGKDFEVEPKPIRQVTQVNVSTDSRLHKKNLGEDVHWRL